MRVIVSGGVGGHSGFAYAIGFHLSRRGHKVTFLIPKRQEWIHERMAKVGEIVELPLPRKPNQPIITSFPRFISLFLKSLGFDWHEHDVFISTGSNFSLVNAVTGWLHGLPVYDLEGESRFLEPSKTSRILSLTRIAKATFLQWHEQKQLHRNGVYVGPVYEPRLYEPREGSYLLVLGGSEGFREMYDLIVRSCRHLLREVDYIVLQTGKIDPGRYNDRCHGKIKAQRYLNDIHWKIANAKYVVTHFPSMTSLTVSQAYNKPLILVKNPYLKTSSSLDNAHIYAHKIGAIVVSHEIPFISSASLRRAYTKSIERKTYMNGAIQIAQYIEKDNT